MTDIQTQHAPAAQSQRAGPPSAPAGIAARRPALLDGPLWPQLLRLALPILVVLVMQTVVGVAETYFVSALGTAALAGVALVFPVLMLMTMLSNGGIGGGVASAIARAIGAGRMKDANALLTHAIVFAIGGGLLFSVLLIGAGRALYRALGASGDVLGNALTYSNLIFAAAVPTWIVNLCAAALRGANNVKVPAALTAFGALLTLALSPLLIFGWGPVPRLGVAGAGWAVITYYMLATFAFAAYLRSARSPLRLSLVPLEWRLFKQILGVGLLSSVGTVTANATVIVAAGLVGRFGADAIAGYGIGSRLDYVLIPLLFAIGTASVTLVGTNVGAGNIARARKAAWIAVAASAGACGLIGGLATFVPQAWVGIFTEEASVIRIGADYLHHVAPTYALFAAGMALYFASQGAGRVTWPLVAGITRMAVVVLGGWLWTARLGGSIEGLFTIIGLSYAVFGLFNLVAFVSPLSWAHLPRLRQAAA